MQKRKLLKIFSFCLIAFALFYFLSLKDKIDLGEVDLKQIEDFDLILSKGQSAQSKLIRILNLTTEDYSHIGILVKKFDKVCVLHSTPDGTKTNGIRYDDLQTFIDLSSVCDFKILRYKNIPANCREKLTKEFAVYKSMQVPFDYDFNNFENKKIYCSELVWIIFKNSELFCNSDFNLEKPIYPNSFLKMNQFATINVKKTNP